GDLLHEVAAARGGGDHVLCIASERRAPGRFLDEHFTVGEDAGQDIVEVMRDAPGKPPDCFHLRGLAQPLLDPLALSVAEFIARAVDHDMDMFDSAIRHRPPIRNLSDQIARVDRGTVRAPARLVAIGMWFRSNSRTWLECGRHDCLRMSVRGRLPGGCFGVAQHNPSLSPASSIAGAAYQSFSDLSCCGVIVVNSAVLIDTLAHHSHEGKAPLGPDFDSIGNAGPPSRRGLTLLWSVRG